MKTIFNNKEIMQIFNEQKQSEGKNSSGSIYFYDNKIYSYGSHYLLGEFIDKDTIIINDYGYSNTTSKHISLLRIATENKKQFFTTKIYSSIVLDNINFWLKKMNKARQRKQYYLNKIDSTFKMYFDYLEYTKQKTHYKTNAKHQKILKLFKNYKN